MPDYTTVGAVKAYLRLTTSVDDTLLARLVSAASAVVQQYCGQDLLTHTVVETVNGAGGVGLVLREFPVQSVQSLAVDGTAIVARPGSGQSGYVFEPSGALFVEGLSFNRGYGNVAIAYTAGYPTTPADVEQAVIDLVARKYKQKDRIGLTSQSVGGETTAYDTSEMPADVRGVLNRYRRVVPL